MEAEPLLVHSVMDDTGQKSYLPAVRKFLVWAQEQALPFETWEDRDIACALYLSHKAYVDDDVGPRHGDNVVNGLVYVYPEGKIASRGHGELSSDGTAYTLREKEDRSRLKSSPSSKVISVNKMMTKAPTSSR